LRYIISTLKLGCICVGKKHQSKPNPFIGDLSRYSVVARAKKSVKIKVIYQKFSCLCVFEIDRGKKRDVFPITSAIISLERRQSGKKLSPLLFFVSLLSSVAVVCVALWLPESAATLV